MYGYLMDAMEVWKKLYRKALMNELVMTHLTIPNELAKFKRAFLGWERVAKR
jgi:hypothetical protein